MANQWNMDGKLMTRVPLWLILVLIGLSPILMGPVLQVVITPAPISGFTTITGPQTVIGSLNLSDGNELASNKTVMFTPFTTNTLTSVSGYYKGVAGTTGTSGNIASAGAAGDFICLVGVDSTHYMVTGAGYGTWTNN